MKRADLKRSDMDDMDLENPDRERSDRRGSAPKKADPRSSAPRKPSRKKTSRKKTNRRRSNSKGSGLKTVFKVLMCLLIIAASIVVFRRIMPLIETKGPGSGEGDIKIGNDDYTERLREIGELATYEKEYRDGRISWGDSRYVLGVAVPLTYTSVEVTYSGSVKVGYDFSEIDCKIDNKNRTVQITLPPVRDFSELPVPDTTTPKNNPFHRIPDDKVHELMEKAKQYELEKAEGQGVYQLAEESAKKIITDLFSDLEGYTVVFTE